MSPSVAARAVTIIRRKPHSRRGKLALHARRATVTIERVRSVIERMVFDQLFAALTRRGARIVPATSQGQLAIEEDLHAFVQRNLTLDDEELTLRREQAIRNYDPCISCATHFLRLEIERV